VQAQANWTQTLGLLDDDKPASAQPVLPAALDGHPEALLLLHPGRNDGEVQALRLWPAPARLRDGPPLWLGTTQTLRYSRPFGVFGIWLPTPDDGAAHDAVRDALDGYTLRESRHPHPQTPTPVLRVRGPASP
jgi:hypothetical protein